MIHVFIVNPMAGNMHFAEGLRKEISMYQDITYYIFDTRYAGYEGELIKKIQHIFEDEKIRIYCCGGQGTMRNIVNDIENLDNVEIAFFPCGLSNDFLKIFNPTDQKRFTHLDELINGEVIDVDYIRINNKNIAINSVSAGIDGRVIKQINDFRFLNSLGSHIPYIWCLLVALFKSGTTKCEVTTSQKHYVDDFTEIYFGNGNVLGSNLHIYEEANVTDGKGKYMFLRSDARKFWTIPIALRFMKKKYKDIDLIAEYGDDNCIYVRRIDDGPINYNVDGELLSIGGTAKIEMVKRGLHFVVPKGVNFDE